MRSSSAKSQAKSALSLFELRDENQRLEKENALLLGILTLQMFIYSVLMSSFLHRTN